MYTASAHFYDLVYSSIKDYAVETSYLEGLLRSLHPEPHTVLDVACGTGEHARALAAAGFAVDGLDLDPTFVQIAKGKHPLGQFVVADMQDFNLSQRYDACLCLGSSIGYLKTLESVARALRCFEKHLSPGGVIVVEPWFEPGFLDPKRVARHIGERKGVRVVRTSRVEVEGRVSRFHFDYEITEGTTTRRVSEVHELGLFTTSELLDTFRNVGLDVDHDTKGLSGRGLYVAKMTA